MARDFNYQPVDYILEQISRIPHYTINEGDVITDISIALGFMVKNAVQEDAVIFLPVKNNMAEMPFGYSEIHRISRYTKDVCIQEDEDLLDLLMQESECLDCEEDEEESFSPQEFIAFKYPYGKFIGSNYYNQAFVPVRPTNNAFFSSLACKNDMASSVYSNCQYEYSIRKGLKKSILFNFSDGYVAISYKRPLTDDSTGYPLIPDDSNANEAILAFVKAKIFEVLDYQGRQGYSNKATEERAKWGKYLKQFNNAAKMPQTEDDYQSDMESKLGSYPNRKRYYNFFNRVARGRRIK